MARIVLGVGSSHGPTIQSKPADWAKLVERDKRDKRYDYQALLRNARPEIERELRPEVQQRRHEAIHAALAKLREVIADARLDVVVVLSNFHRRRDKDNLPVFGIFRSESFATATMSRGIFDMAARYADVRTDDQVVTERPGHPELANYLVSSLIDSGFDISLTDNLPEGDVLDDAFSFPDEWLLNGKDIPLVPFQISRDLPNQATASRCYDLGLSMRRQIERWPADARVGVIASGGLSHQVLDEELDKEVIDALVGGDSDTLRRLQRERLNRGPGTPEILNWVTLAGVMAPEPMQLIDYQPCYRSPAGTGHGICIGYWRP
jgi:Catalytic LigB subunit of aromatic ring-opening dioxygenase